MVLKRFYLWLEHKTGSYAPLLVGILLSVLLLVLAFLISKALPERYPDFIVDWLSSNFANKSDELHGIWLALLGGSVLMVVLLLKRYSHFSLMDTTNVSISRFTVLGLLWLVIPTVLRFCLAEPPDLIYWLAVMVFAALCWLHHREAEKYTESLCKKIVLLLLLGYYAWLGLINLATVLMAGRFAFTPTILALLSGGLAAAIYGLRKICHNDKIIDYAIVLLQAALPPTLLAYLMDKYIYEGQVVTLAWPQSYVLFYGSLCLVLMVLAVLHIWHFFRRPEENSPSSLIAFSSVASIFLLHTSVGHQRVWLLPDLWHAGDSMVTWYQCVEQGLEPCFEFMPNSGFFGMVSSALQAVFLTPGALDYQPSQALTASVFAVWLAVLAWKHFSPATALLLATAFFMHTYNRSWIILPMVWTLLLPALQHKRILWLGVYVFLCTAGFFYYPLNGAAVGAGLFPLFISQLVKLWRERGTWWKASWGQKGLTVGILMLTLSFLAAVLPYIWQMLLYMKSMSSQTIWADGIKSYPFTIPDWFLPFLGRSRFIVLLFDTFEYLLVFVAVLLALRYLVIFLKQRNWQDEAQVEDFYWYAAALLILLVSAQYTLVRMDLQSLLARMNHTLGAVALGILAMAAYRRLGAQPKRAGLAVTAVFFSIAMMLSTGWGREAVPNIVKLPNGYVRISADTAPHTLGDGFMRKGQLEHIQKMEHDLDALCREGESVILPEQMMYLFLERKTPVVCGAPQIRHSWQAVRPVLKELDEQPPAVVSGLTGISAYYYENWFLEHQYVLYQGEGSNWWIHPHRYEEIFGRDAREARRDMEEIDSSTFTKKLGMTPASWGNSLNSLSKRMEEVKTYEAEVLSVEAVGNGFVIHLPQAVDGQQADFVYLDLSPLLAEDAGFGRRSQYWLREHLNLVKKFGGQVRLSWQDETGLRGESRSVTMEYVNGKLLIPLGMIPVWKNHATSDLQVTFSNMDGDVLPEFHRVSFWHVVKD